MSFGSIEGVHWSAYGALNLIPLRGRIMVLMESEVY